MKKKLILALFLSFIFLSNVNAKEYKLNEFSGHYAVKDAGCSYTLLDGDITYGFKIVIKNDQLTDIISLDDYTMPGKYGVNLHFNSLKYESFFQDKEFSCPKNIFDNFQISSSKEGKYGHNLEMACNAEDVGEKRRCKKATYVEGSGFKKYYEKSEKDPSTTKKSILTCSYKKITSSINGGAQAAAEDILIYNKYEDDSQNFVSSINYEDSYKITDGTLESCINNLYVLRSDTGNSYRIVDTCNDSTNINCINYQKESTASTFDSDMNDDGSTNNANASGVVDPTHVSALEPVKTVEFSESTCKTLLGDTIDKNAPAYYLDFAFKLIKYAAIIMLFVFTIIEYAKAVASSNQDAIKKATQTTIKRLIIAVIIFFLPILINFILRVLGVISTNGTCGIGF